MTTASKQAPPQQQPALSRPGKLIKLLDKHGINHKAAQEWAKEMKPFKEVLEKDYLTHERVAEAVSAHPKTPLLSCHGRHALFGAAERAYNQHLALRLRPDDVWLTIAQGVAEHINAPGNAEAFRSKFVAHEGKMELVVVQGPEPEYEAFVEDVVVLAEQNMVDTTLPAALRCDFTTTTPASAIASRIVIMKALESYFTYTLMCTCGIPAVIMEGSLEDWERVEAKVRQVESLDLGLDWWFKDLKPVLAKLTDTFKGQVDEEWWGRILTRRSLYSGHQDWTGWMCTFVPYDSDKKRREDVTQSLDYNKVPSGTQTVAFKLIKDGRERKMELLVGFLGCTVDAAEGSIAPCIGWAVAEDSTAAEVKIVKAKVDEALAAIAAWAVGSVPGATLAPALAPSTQKPDQRGGATVEEAEGAESWRLAQMRRLAAAVKELRRLAEEREATAGEGARRAKAASAGKAAVDAVVRAAYALENDPRKASTTSSPEAEELAQLRKETREEISCARELLRSEEGAPQREGLLGAVQRCWRSARAV